MSETTTPLTLALSKGRIFEETMPLLAEAGIEVPENPESSRKLILPTSDPGLRLIIVRASDVPTYVQYGAADLGIAGKDVLIEHAAQQPGGLYQPIDLNIAAPPGRGRAQGLRLRRRRAPGRAPARGHQVRAVSP